MTIRPVEILAIGAASMDIGASTAQPLLAHDSNPGRIRCTPGGVARNVAENLARLGHGVRLLSVVGDDAFGDQLLEATRRAGVEVQACLRLVGQASASYLSLHGPDGDMATAVNDMAILAQLTPQWLAASAIDPQRQARALLVDCNLSDAALAWVFGAAGAIAIFAEPVSAFKCRRLLPWLAQVHTLKANRLELRALTGLPVDDADEATLQRAAQWLHAQGVRQLVVSLGERGAWWSERAGGCGWQRALAVSVTSATGAGDAMMAGLLHRHLQGDTLAQALVFATGCAALTLGAPGANHPDLSVGAVHELLASFQIL